MDLIVPIVNGIGEIRRNIPPGTYEIQIIRIPGYEPELYSGSLATVTETITIDPAQRESVFLTPATGAVTVVIQLMNASGEIVDFPTDQINGFVVRRSDAEGNFYEGSATLNQVNEIVFPNLPYGCHAETGVIDGPMVSLAIDTSTLPSSYALESPVVVTKQLVSNRAEDNVFPFILKEQSASIIQVNVLDGSASISRVISEEGTDEYLGISGVLTIE